MAQQRVSGRHAALFLSTRRQASTERNAYSAGSGSATRKPKGGRGGGKGRGNKSAESKRERPSGNFGEGTQSAKDFDVEQMVSNFENGTELLRLRAELEASKKSMSDSKQALKMAANDYFKGGAH